MVEKLADVWATRDLPVLIEITRQVDDGGSGARGHVVAKALGLSEDDVARSVSALARNGYVIEQAGFIGHGWVSDVTEKAYLATGLYPSSEDTVDAFVEALRKAADQTDNPDEKSGLRKLARSAGDVSTNVLGAVLAAVATRAAGLG